MYILVLHWMWHNAFFFCWQIFLTLRINLSPCVWTCHPVCKLVTLRVNRCSCRFFPISTCHHPPPSMSSFLTRMNKKASYVQILHILWFYRYNYCKSVLVQCILPMQPVCRHCVCTMLLCILCTCIYVPFVNQVKLELECIWGRMAGSHYWKYM